MKKTLFSIFVLIIIFSFSSITAYATLWPTVPDTSNSNTMGTDNAQDEYTQSNGAGGALSPTSPSQYESTNIEGRYSVIGDNDEAYKVYQGYADVMPVVSTNDILRWATTKGNEIIYFLQIIVQPLTIIFFIIAAFMTLVGSVGRGDMVGKGVYGMIIAVIVYACVLYAPVILQTFVGWIAS